MGTHEKRMYKEILIKHKGKLFHYAKKVLINDHIIPGEIFYTSMMSLQFNEMRDY